MKKITLIPILCMCLITCKKNEDPTGPTITLLTFTQDPVGLQTSGTDDWIFVTDEAGVILDTEAFEAGQTVTLTTNRLLPSEKINITVFRYGGVNSSSLTSYLSIPVGQTWSFMAPAVNSGPQNSGTANLTITNFPNPGNLSGFAFTDASGALIASGGSFTTPTTFTTQLTLNRTPTRIYVSFIQNGVPLALVLNNVMPGAVLFANFNTDFKPLNHSVTINFTGSNTVQAHVAGLTGNGQPTFFSGNMMYEHNYTTVTGPLTIGYNDGFDAYKTDIGIVSGPGIFRTYSKIGAVPSSAPLLNYTLSVEKDDLRDFSFTLSGNFHVRHSMWDLPSSTSTQSWHVYGPPGGKQKFPSIPSEISGKYPALQTDKFKYSSNIFTLFLDGFTYDDYIKQGISGPWTKYPAESQSIQIK